MEDSVGDKLYFDLSSRLSQFNVNGMLLFSEIKINEKSAHTQIRGQNDRYRGAAKTRESEKDINTQSHTQAHKYTTATLKLTR